MKILIVDDKTETLYLLETLFKGSGYEVVSARNGVEAFEKLKKDSFDMIISDILMPKMDGFQLCGKCKRDDTLRKIPFIFYTATYTDKKDEEFALSLGAERFIVKPMEPERFMEIIESTLRDYEKGLLTPSEILVEKEEVVYLKEYNERLIKKIEKKMLDLEKANIELNESEQKYRELVNNVNDGVMLIEPKGYLSFVNPKFCEMMGYTVKEAKKLHFSKLIHPEDLSLIAEKVEKSLAGKEAPRSYEVRFLTKSKEVIYVDYNPSIIEREGRLVGILCIIRDITERKRVEEELQKSQEQLYQTQKLQALGALMAGVAHEVNDPINQIMLNTPLLKKVWHDFLPILKEHAGKEPDRKYGGLAYDFLKDNLGQLISDMDMAVNRVAKIVTDLKDFARQSDITNKIPISINTAVENAIRLARTTIKKSGIELKLNLGHNLPLMEGDLQRVEQIILNLVINAVQAIDHDRGEVKIATGFQKKEERIYISISDNGRGIDPSIANKIFDPFVTDKQAQGGTGIGLSITYSLVKAHGGEITFKGQKGEGTTFTVYFPIIKKEGS